MSMRLYTEKFRLAGTGERPLNIVYFVLREYLHEKVLDVGSGQGRHRVESPYRMLKEFYRCLKPGGDINSRNTQSGLHVF